MKITQVTVMVHEKRNHPFEYGHYDAEVRLTADLDSTDGAIDAVEQLTRHARVAVVAECDQWIDSLERKRRAAHAVQEIERLLRQMKREYSDEYYESYAQQLVDLLNDLPEESRKGYANKVNEAAKEYALRAHSTGNVEHDPQEDEDEDENGPF